MAVQTLKDGLHAAKAEFASRLIAVLVERTDVSQKQIGRDFGVSESFVKKTARRFAVPYRKRGPKPKRNEKGETR
jgi:transposase